MSGAVQFLLLIFKQKIEAMTRTDKEKLSEVLVIAGLAAYAYYKYSKLSADEKTKIVNDIKETGRNVIKELIPDEIKGFIPGLK